MKVPIILAADGLTLKESTDLIFMLSVEGGHKLDTVKVHNLYDEHGPMIINELRGAGAKRVWVDFKLHDIPETVRARAKALARAGASIISVHISGEYEMMVAALEGVREVSNDVRVYGVTLLTSLEEARGELIYGHSSMATVLSFARLAKLAGLHGVVSSPQEVKLLAGRPELAGMDLVTPGMRLEGAEMNDQQRIATPSAAVKLGATHLVVGRPITQAEDPIAAYRAFMREANP